MSPIEDEIRGALGAEATRLREVRPLCLPPVAARPGASAAPGARWLRNWLGPATAVAAVLLVTAALITVKSFTYEHAAPAPSSGSIAGPALPAGATPRYYVTVGPVPGGKGRWAVLAGDGPTGKMVGGFLLPQGYAYSWAATGAADDRTFVVDAVQMPTTGHPGFGPATWYLVRLFPGSADPVRVTRLPIQSRAGGGLDAMALSGDGTELAVLYTVRPPVTSFQSDTVKSQTLRVYSVATGRQQHAWTATFTKPVTSSITDLSWVADSTVGFAVTDRPQVSEEVRTLTMNAADPDLMGASRLVWSQDGPPPPGAASTAAAPHACGTAFLTGNGQAVVCATSTYSARDKSVTTTWLAYPVATPAGPRVIGSVTRPATGIEWIVLPLPAPVQWTNSSGTEVIGTWTGGFEGVIGGGTVRPFPLVHYTLVAW